MWASYGFSKHHGNFKQFYKIKENYASYLNNAENFLEIPVKILRIFLPKSYQTLRVATKPLSKEYGLSWKSCTIAKAWKKNF